MDNKNSHKLHSVTFYIPSNKIESFTVALKKVSSEIYGDNKRNVSKYIRDLIFSDLEKRGFLETDLVEGDFSNE